jgi:hypothetical protein
MRFAVGLLALRPSNRVAGGLRYKKGLKAHRLKFASAQTKTRDKPNMGAQKVECSFVKLLKSKRQSFA